MAARLLLGSLSHSRRVVQATNPRFCDQSICQPLWSHFSGCFDSLNHFRPVGEPVKSFPTRTRPSSSVSSLFSTSTVVSEVGCISLDRQELASPVIISGQRLSYSNSALAIEEDETVRQAAEIGYEVLGQYVSESPRIKPQAAFAVVQVGSHQFKVTPGDMIYTEKLKHADINDKVLLNKVLLMGSLTQTIIGRPSIPEACVLAAVEEIALDAKIIVFKKKRRKNYRRTNGHRQELTRLRILEIEGLEAPSSGSDDVLLAESPV